MHPFTWLGGVLLSAVLSLSLAPAAQAESFLPMRALTVFPDGAAGLCKKYNWACARGANTLPSASVLPLADQVNRRINAAVPQVSDQSQYRRDEYWTLPSARGGDCEDFALLKKRELLAAGLPADALLIATVLDHTHRPHAVLVLRTNAGDYVLDNLNNRLLPWKQTGYTFLKIQNPDAPHSWRAVLAGGLARG